MVHITSRYPHKHTHTPDLSQPWVNPRMRHCRKKRRTPTMVIYPNKHFTAVLSTWHTHCLKSKNQKVLLCVCVCVNIVTVLILQLRWVSASLLWAKTAFLHCRGREHASYLSQSGLFLLRIFSQPILTLGLWALVRRNEVEDTRTHASAERGLAKQTWGNW